MYKHFERYCNTLPGFGFNNARYDINLIKRYLLPILENEPDFEPIVVNPTFLGRVDNAVIQSFLRWYKTIETSPKWEILQNNVEF